MKRIVGNVNQIEIFGQSPMSAVTMARIESNRKIEPSLFLSADFRKRTTTSNDRTIILMIKIGVNNS
jgi:hypothetical protein